MDDVVGIITKFASYLSELITYIMEIFGKYTKKDENKEEEGTTAAA